jgi:putative flavoprotein involved in K+ transport
MKTDINLEKSKWGTIIIGGGQAGLSMGYHLSKIHEDFIILDAGGRVGDSWRRRWDSLHLFTPAQFDSLPGFKLPSGRGSYPSKDEMADYLERYSKRFELPIRLNVKANRLLKIQAGFEISTNEGPLTCDRVVVATGTNRVPRVPDFAKELDDSIFQIHSSQYTNPDSLPSGKVLVVGAGTSGVEIAIELSGTRQTLISGNPTFHIPDAVFRYAGRLYWWFGSNILTVRTPVGRKAKEKILKGGGPLVNVSVEDLEASGAERLPRMAGVENGQPKMEDGRLIPVSSVVWATGFKPDFSWIDLEVTDQAGWPLTNRGLSTTIEGMSFLGMLFQYGLTSGLAGGVGRDASYISKHIHRQVRR